MPVEGPIAGSVRPASRRQIVSHGTVEGVPWSLQAFLTTPAGEWWEAARPVGPELEFVLGSRGEHGKSLVNTWIPDDHFVTATGIVFRRLPGVVVWIGTVSNEIENVKLSLKGYDPKHVRTLIAGTNFPRCFCVFLPRAAEARLEVVDSAGGSREACVLPTPSPPTGRMHAITLNPIGWPPHEPPPGWPKETRAFDPGEGERWGDDLFAHVSPFPLYVLPPEDWDGVARSATASRPWSIDRGTRITDVTFSYAGQANSTRSLDIVNSNPEEVEFRAGAWKEPGWWFDQRLDAQSVMQFRNGFELDLSILLSGPARYLGGGKVQIEGIPSPVERWTFPNEPELSLVRVHASDWWITVRGFDIDDTELLVICGQLRRLELESGLLERMKRAGFGAPGR